MSYFEHDEFRCPCCGVIMVSAWLVHLLNKVRAAYGKPMIVSSGYRCEKHNKKVGGKSNSAHLRGTAADIKCNNSSDRYLLLKLALLCGFKRIGVSPKFIHLDVDEDLDQRVFWLY